PSKDKRTIWNDYTILNSYSSEEAQAKISFIKKFTQTVQPKVLLDLGCNKGFYSELALMNGARAVIGIDSDPHACNEAFARSSEKNLQLNVLQMDLTNPSSYQGWRSKEFQSLGNRLHADGMIALALLHHFVLGKNIPMASAIDYLIEQSPQGIIEFVDKADMQVQKMLQFREDIFADYTMQDFLDCVNKKAQVIEKKHIGDNRTLIWYKRIK
ncbi:MAG TPA: hypothetical protein PLD88_15190, partial [Candidatus Berkiella sp.]|nr:hypothetical protein [Candidatus Berkiella sp.]